MSEGLVQGNSLCGEGLAWESAVREGFGLGIRCARGFGHGESPCVRVLTCEFLGFRCGRGFWHGQGEGVGMVRAKPWARAGARVSGF